MKIKHALRLVTAISVFAISSLHFGVAAAELPQPSGERVEDVKAAIAKLRKNANTSGVIRGEVNHEHGSKRVDAIGLIGALEAHEMKSALEISDSDLKFYARVGHKSMFIDRVRAVIEVRDDRGLVIDVNEHSKQVRLPDSMLKQQAKALMRAMAIEVDDESVEVRSLMAMSKDEKGIETREVARKVFVDRRISGIPVHGNRLVFTFTNNGEFRNVRGQWHDYNADVSITHVSDSIEQILDRAFQRVENAIIVEGLVVREQDEARILTRLMPTLQEDKEVAMMPVAEIFVPIHGPQDESDGTEGPMQSFIVPLSN